MAEAAVISVPVVTEIREPRINLVLTLEEAKYVRRRLGPHAQSESTVVNGKTVWDTLNSALISAGEKDGTWDGAWGS